MRILAGTETEYGLLISGRGAEDQIEDAMAVVRSYPDHRCFVGWDYRHESPRNDLRGFAAERLTIDPEDAKFDTGKTWPRDVEVRSDRVLPSGARFYNDHGHPEYATPEAWTLCELVRHDVEGQAVALEAARAYTEATGRGATIYKNNTDFHGASYGTHESYLMPREVGFASLYAALVPMLIARTVLCGAGKVGAESGGDCAFQLSQRADFFSETASVDTLFRRPIFNTRDEPHSDPRAWIRVHVIAGDANMIPRATWRKVGLLKIALTLAQAGAVPAFDLEDPVTAFRRVSRDESYRFEMGLADGKQTTAFEILETYCSAAETHLQLDDEMTAVIREARALMSLIFVDFAEFARHVDWAAKRKLLEQVMELEGLAWRDKAALQSYDLEYHNVDPDEGLAYALDLDHSMPEQVVGPFSRAAARGYAVSRFLDQLENVGWRKLTFAKGELDLAPDLELPHDFGDFANLESFLDHFRA